jgi:hypothetical protein
MMLHRLSIRAWVLLILAAAGVARAQPLPVTGSLDFGQGAVFSASGNTSVSLSQQLSFPNPFDTSGRDGTAFGTLSSDLPSGAIRGEQGVNVPFASSRVIDIETRFNPIVTIQPGPDFLPGVRQITLDLVLNGLFQIPTPLFGPGGTAVNFFDVRLLMRDVTNNTGTLVDAAYRYNWSAANSGTGVSESFSHTPFTFAAGAGFNASVGPDDPLSGEFKQGFRDMRLHIDFPYDVGSGTLIQLETQIRSFSSVFFAGAAGDWENSAILHLTLPQGTFLADSSGNPLPYNWDGTGGVGVTPIPEPETWALFVAGLGLISLARRRRKLPRVRG